MMRDVSTAKCLIVSTDNKELQIKRLILKQRKHNDS